MPSCVPSMVKEGRYGRHESLEHRQSEGREGKTTLALHLAIAAARDLKVLVIDLDPQQSAERWHAIRQRTTGSKDDPSIASGPYQNPPDMLKTARKLGAELVLIDTPPKLDKAIAPSLAAATTVSVPLRACSRSAGAGGLRDVATSRGPAARRSLSSMPSGGAKWGCRRQGKLALCGRLKLEVAPERLSELPALSQGLRPVAASRSPTEFARRPKKSPRSTRRSGRATKVAENAGARHAIVDRRHQSRRRRGPRGRRAGPPGLPAGRSPPLRRPCRSGSHRRSRPTRTGRKGIVIYVEQDVAAAIRRLAADYNTTVQALGETAFKYLFEKLGEPSSA